MTYYQLTLTQVVNDKKWTTSQLISQEIALEQREAIYLVSQNHKTRNTDETSHVDTNLTFVNRATYEWGHLLYYIVEKMDQSMKEASGVLQPEREWTCREMTEGYGR